MTSVLEHLQTLAKGDKISLIVGGVIIDGTFEELVDGRIKLNAATSPSVQKGKYHLDIPIESIYAWGKKEKKKKQK